LFAFDTRFVDESVIAVSPCLPFHCIPPPPTSTATQPVTPRFPSVSPPSLSGLLINHIAYRSARDACRVAFA
jgi:hypothetical protein